MPKPNQEEKNVYKDVELKPLSKEKLTHIKNINKYIIIIIIILTFLIASIISLMIYKTVNKRQKNKVDISSINKKTDYKLKDNTNNPISIDIFKSLKDNKCIRSSKPIIIYHPNNTITLDYKSCRIIFYIPLKEAESKLTHIKY
jgi:hypothetical protein